MKSELMLESAVNFMINSMFACIGALIITVTILVINNLFHRHWKAIDFFPAPRSSDDQQEPELQPTQKRS